MLVLTRKQNEKIRIGSSIVITVVRMKGKAVRLGIEAPGDVNILRGELAFETAADEPNEDGTQLEASLEDHSLDQPIRREKSQKNIPTSHPNPTSQWSGGLRDEPATTNPKSTGNTNPSRRPIEMVGSTMI